MKSNFTTVLKSRIFSKVLYSLIMFFAAFSFYSCSATAQENISKKPESSEQNDDEKVFTFHQEKNGKDNLWKVIFRDGKISELYKNGQKIPNENIEDYADMVNDELSGLSYNSPFSMHPNFHFNFTPHDNDWEENESEDSTYNDDLNVDINGDFCDSLFDGEGFKHQMHNLKDQLKHLKKMKFNFHFDTAALNKGMRDLQKNLNHMKFGPNEFYFDQEAFRDGMKEFGEEMKHSRIFDEDIKIDLSDLNKNMEEFTHNMKNFTVNMKGFKEKMKKFKGFMNDLRKELVRDNLIKSEDEHFKLEFDAKEMKINDKIVPDNLFNKYKGIYKEHFGKDIDDSFYIHSDHNDFDEDDDH